MKRYQTTPKQTHEACAAQNAQNVAHYHCSKNLLATLLNFPNHGFVLAAKVHKPSPIWHFYPAIRLVAFVVSSTPPSTA